MNTRFFCIVSIICLLFIKSNSQSLTELKVSGVRDPVLILNGSWDFRLNPGQDFWDMAESGHSWDNIKVPGECSMQGYDIEQDKPVAYQKKFLCPADFSGKKIFLRFDGVYSYARLWVNGKFIRDHNGGFTRWESDVTGIIKPGKINTISLEVTDRADDVSFGSGYAHHNIGGILRDVTLYTMPVNHFEILQTETDLDENYRNAMLMISGTISATRECTVDFKLFSPEGNPVPLKGNPFLLNPGQKTIKFESQVDNPKKWDAEHPYLYTLKTTITEKGKMTYSFLSKVGFREIKIEGNKLLVNGQTVKLRGACRHDIHPLLGRVSTTGYTKIDVELAKEANMNFIRTSHYPPCEYFLDLCDAYGLYVECENAMCFVETTTRALYRKGISTDDSKNEDQYLPPVKEMVNAFRNHPSVLFWSLGNESKFGSNILKSYQWIKQNDKTRPVIFSYPGSVPDNVKSYDILSMHYPDPSGKRENQKGMSVYDFTYQKMPVIFDEWAHVPSYLQTRKYNSGVLNFCKTLQEDLNERDYWGKTIDLMWSGVFDAPGGLGGAIWGMIDETFMLPDTLKRLKLSETQNTSAGVNKNPVKGYGEWGIIDTWRRKKPEFWNTKKGYSPVKILQTTITGYAPGEDLQLPVYNRFDHTNLNELKVKYSYREKVNIIGGNYILPHNKGLISIPAENWTDGEQLLVQFIGISDELIDEEIITLGFKKTAITEEAGIYNSILKLTDTLNQIVITGVDFKIPFSKKTGLIEKAARNGVLIIESGPFLNLNLGDYITPSLSDWKFNSINASVENDVVRVATRGKMNEQELTLHYRINSSGEMLIYFVVNPSVEGWIFETGLCFILPEGFDQLEWDRKSYWTTYPANHIGSPRAKVNLFEPEGNTIYRQKPRTDWSFDNYSFKYHGLPENPGLSFLSNIAKSTKENIRSYQLSGKLSLQKLTVFSDKYDIACRLKSEDDLLYLFINNNWDYPGPKFFNYSKNIMLEPFTGVISLNL